MPTDPTMVFQNILRVVKTTDSHDYWKFIESQFLILPSDSVGTWLSAYYLSALLFAQQNKTALEVSSNKFISSIREGIEKHYILLKQDKRWVGANYQNGLMGDLERLINNLNGRFGGKQLEDLVYLLQNYQLQSSEEIHANVSEIKEGNNKPTKASSSKKPLETPEKIIGIKLFFEPYGTEALIISDKRYLSFSSFSELNYKQNKEVELDNGLLTELPAENQLAKTNAQRASFRKLDKSLGAGYTQSEEIGHLFSPLSKASKYYSCLLPRNGTLKILSNQVNTASLDSPHFRNISDKPEYSSPKSKSDIQSIVRNYIYECSQDSVFHWSPEEASASVNYRFRVLENADQIEITGTIHCANISKIQLQSGIPELLQNPGVSAPVFLIGKDGKKSDIITGQSGPGIYTISLPGFWSLIVTCSHIYITEQPEELQLC